MDRLALLMLALCLPVAANAQCRLCSEPATPSAVPPTRALAIDVETALDFSRAAQAGAGGGAIAVDERSGARAVSGGLVDLGGIALKGVVTLSGEPGRHVRVSLPQSIILTAPDGGSAEVVDLRTDLSADPALDGAGRLRFAFGGRLVVRGGASGDFRGRIAIVADYQ